jgi:hypothetical protein
MIEQSKTWSRSHSSLEGGNAHFTSLSKLSKDVAEKRIS